MKQKWVDVWVNGKMYEVLCDEDLPCDDDCTNCPYHLNVGEDDFVEVCSKTGEVF